MTTTFLAELERLRAAATEGKIIAYDETQQAGTFKFSCTAIKGPEGSNIVRTSSLHAMADAKLWAFLANHADAIAELVRAATSAHQTLADEGFHAKAVRLGNALANLDKLNGGKQ